jgi:hypothetical protein
MFVPVGESGTPGVPLCATVAGQGSSLQVGSVHVSSSLQVAVSVVENPGAQDTAIPVPVGDDGADGVFPFAGAVAGHASSLHSGSIHVSSTLHVDVSKVEYPVAQVTV